MVKKIFDIIPPQERLKERVLKPLPKEEPKILTEKKRIRNSTPFIFKIVPIFILIIIIAGGFLYFSLAKARIEIWPETKVFDLNTKITIDKEIKQIDISAKNIPGAIFETNEMATTQEFLSSGEVKKKAAGAIRIYNNYSASPTTFRANTRFMSDSGLVFQSEGKVVVPGKPGYVDIKVIAIEPGADYNIDSATFSLPGLAGTPLYTYFYGKSFSPMSGGGMSSKVTQEDLDKAEEILTEKALNDCQTALKNRISQEFILLKDASECEIIEAFSPVKVGSELNNFIYTVKTKGKALSFKTQDLKKFADNFIISQSPQDNVLNEASLKMNYSVDSISLTAGKMTISLQIGGKTYFNINQNAIKNSLMGKSLKESELLLENQPGIKRAQVIFLPFWVGQVPDNLVKVEIRINLDPAPNLR